MSALALWKLLPRWAKEVVVLLVLLGATYAFAEHNGRTVQRQQDTTAEQARLTARLAHQRDSLTRAAVVQGAVAQARRDTVRVGTTRYLARRATLPSVSVTPSVGKMDTLRLRYPDSTVAVFTVPESVAVFVQEQARQLAMADTLLQTQVETAMQADSAQIATLWAAGRASDSLVNVQRESLHRLNRYLTHATHGVAYDVTAGCLTGAAAGGAVRGVQGAIGGTLIGCGSGYLLHALRH